jgi:hypothetical protein
VRGREYYISLDPDSKGHVVAFTTDCAQADSPLSWLPSIQPGQTLHIRVNVAFPNHLYYQDTKDNFLGGPVVVARNFMRKKKESSGDCESDAEEEESDTKYDE